MPLTTRTVSATEAKTIKAAAEAKSLEDNAAKGGQLPLHYAAKEGASLNVVKLLLKANPGAATAVDGARCSAQAVLRIHISPPTLPPHRRVRHLSRDLVQSPSDTTILHRTPRTQVGELPLHCAVASKGAPFDVVKLLLEANPEAAAVVAQARRRAHMTTITLC